MNNVETRPVLIIGGGPVGLSLALELAWRGTPQVLIEQTDGTVDHPRAGGISIRTMEHCRRWGVSDDVRNCGFNARLPLNQRFCTSVTGFELATAEYPSLSEMQPAPTSPERLWRCRQMWFDPILAARAKALGADLRYGKTLESFVDRGDGVVCTIADVKTGERSQIVARYLVACDGAGSEIRERLGVKSEGEILGRSVSILFRANIRELLGGAFVERFILLSRDGPYGTITAMDGFDLWRLIVRETNDYSRETFDARAAIRRAIGAPDAKFEVISVRPWRRAQVVAASFRAGNVFLAGDAAHVMVPTGGFGANTGIGDAVDLGWKLNAVQQGWAGPNLIDSYEAERKPIARRNMAEAMRNYRSWTPGSELSQIDEDTPHGAEARKRIGRELVEGTEQEWDSTGVALGYAYLDSPICIGDGTQPPPDDPRVYIPTARPGHRAPHAWIAPGRSMLDLYGNGFVLVRFDGDDRAETETLMEAARKRRMPVRLEDVRNAQIHELYAQRLVLVRPDGHVAWRGSSLADPQSILATAAGA